MATTYNPNRVLICKLKDLPEKLGKTVVIGERELAVFKLADGSIRAVENRCPHRGGKLSEGMVSGEYVFCPMHDWKISLIDGQAQGADEGCVKTYSVKVVGEEVYILLND